MSEEQRILADCQALVDGGEATWVDPPAEVPACHLCQGQTEYLVYGNDLWWCPAEDWPECNFIARGRLRVPLRAPVRVACPRPDRACARNRGAGGRPGAE